MKTLKFNTFTLLAVAILLSFAACDIVKNPGDPNAKKPISKRVVLVEEFTGHGCGNCPRSHEEAVEIAAFFDTCVVFVAIHSGFFSDATGTFFGDSFKTNFKIPFGEGIDDYYEADEAGFPKGLVNRKEVDGESLLEYTEWRTQIYDELLQEHVVGLNIETDYDSATRNVDIDVWVEYQTDGTADDNLVVIITEDSVVSPQKDYTLGDDYKYVHRHILRAPVTPNQWGEQLKSSAPAAQELLTRSYSITLDPGWDPHHCHVVAYVMNAGTKYVYQASETYVTGH